VIVYSAIFGGFDSPKPPRPHPAVAEWVLFTDDPNVYAPGWRVVVSDPPGATARMRAKWYKCHPPRHALSLYLDGSIRLRDPGLLDAAIGALTKADWAMFRHPERSDITAEALASAPMPKYAGAPLREQVRAYEALYTAEALRKLSLWAAGILARRGTPDVVAASHAWWQECVRWTEQDQISLPVVLDRFDIVPAAIEAGGGLWNNAHFRVEVHHAEPSSQEVDARLHPRRADRQEESQESA